MSDLSPAVPTPWCVDTDPRPGMEWNRHILDANGKTVCFMAHSGGDDPDGDGATAWKLVRAVNAFEAMRGMLQEVHAEVTGPRFTDRAGWGDQIAMILGLAEASDISPCACGKQPRVVYNKSAPAWRVRCECGKQTREYINTHSAVAVWNQETRAK